MHLYINTTNNLQTLLKLNEVEYRTNYSSPRQQDVFSALQQALRQSNIKLSDLSSIEVATGPGSFTGIRVGLSIAHTLSFALNLPINDQPPGTILTPNYGKPPGITISPKSPPTST